MELEVRRIGQKPLIYLVYDKDMEGMRTWAPMECLQAAFQHEHEAVRYVQQRYAVSADEGRS